MRQTKTPQLASILSGLVELLDGASVLLDREGSILSLNSSARALLRDGAVIGTGQGHRLKFQNRDDCEAFKREFDSLREANPPAHRHLRIAGRTSGIGSPPLDRVSMLAIGATSDVVVPPLAVLISIRSGLGRAMVSADLLRLAFDLTKTEASVAAALAAGANIEEVARQRGRQPATIRNQQYAAYSKMGVASHAELVACVAQVLPRLVPPDQPR